jgi:ABC-type sugar transport system permease subunit
MIIYLDGLQGIPASFYEAAEVDGANWFQKITRITWPLLRPVTFYLVVTGVISSVQVYSYIMIMTSDPRGGPLDSTTTVVFEIYKNVVLYNRIGYACAISMVLFFVIMILTAVNFQFAGESLEY